MIYKYIICASRECISFCSYHTLRASREIRYQVRCLKKESQPSHTSFTVKRLESHGGSTSTSTSVSTSATRVATATGSVVWAPSLVAVAPNYSLSMK